MASDKRTADRPLTEEDRRLWNRISQTVSPLPRPYQGPGAHTHRSTPQKTGTGQSGDSAMPAKDRPTQPYRGAIDERTVRRLARGRIEIDSRIDLHGMTQARAHTALQRFLEKACRRGDRIVLVITGKGRDRDGILRRAVPLWLEEGGMRSIAGAWRPAHPAHGGEGALYIRLRRQNPKEG